MPDPVDILILHGRSNHLITYLKDVFSSLGIRSDTVLSLPSEKKAQEQRVEHYIKSCKMALVLVTFDESEPESSKARPNVYDEIARCRRLKKKDTLVLQERCKKKLVELPSNVDGKLVVIQFEQSALHSMLPYLFTEIRSRGLLVQSSSAAEKSKAGQILNRFLDQMDNLWDDEFDEAWDNVHRKDYHAERNFAVLLDSFFQQYQNVFSALIREKKAGDDLIGICNEAFDESHKLAARAWEIVAEAKMRQADNGTDSENANVRRQLDSAATILKNAKRTSGSALQIKVFRDAVRLLSRV